MALLQLGLSKGVLPKPSESDIECLDVRPPRRPRLADDFLRIGTGWHPQIRPATS